MILKRVPPILFYQKLTKNDHFENDTSYPFLSKTDQFEKKNIPKKKTLTRSDEKSCKTNLAIKDLANKDFETLTRSAKKKKQHYLANRGPY